MTDPVMEAPALIAVRTLPPPHPTPLRSRIYLELERFAVFGHSGGGPRALACAALLPDRVPAAISVSATAPWPAPGLDYFAGMADGTARELRAAAQGRAALEQVLAENEFDPESFIAADYAALDGSWSWFNGIVQAATVDGPDGMIEDDLGSMAPWGFDPALITTPTLIMHGTDDRMVPELTRGMARSALSGRRAAPGTRRGPRLGAQRRA